MIAKNQTRDINRSGLLFGLLSILVGIATGMFVIAFTNPLVPIVITLGLVAVFATLRRIELGLLALVFMTWTRLSDVAIKYHNAPSILQWFFVFILALILIRWLLYGETPQGWMRIVVLIGGYGMVGVASLFAATDSGHGADWIITFIKDGAIAVIVAILITRAETLRRVVWILLSAGIFLGTISTFQYVTSTFGNNYGGFAQAGIENIIGATNNYRIAGPLGDPNFYAQILLVLVSLALDRMLGESSPWLRLLALWALIVCTLSVIFTFSRGGFFALSAVLALRFVIRPPSLPLALVVITLGVVLFAALPPNYTSRISTLVNFIPGITQDPRDLETSLRGRTSAFMVGIMMFADHPILGVGKGNYPYNYQNYSRILGIDTQLWEQEPHNLYIEVLSETGLLGILFFGAILWFMFRSMFQARDMLKEAMLTPYADLVTALMLGIFGYLITSIFLHAAYPRYFWLLVGLALATSELARHELDLYRDKQFFTEQESKLHHALDVAPSENQPSYD